MYDLAVLADLEAEQINGGLLNFNTNASITSIRQGGIATAVSGNTVGFGIGNADGAGSRATVVNSANVGTVQVIRPFSIGLVN